MIIISTSVVVEMSKIETQKSPVSLDKTSNPDNPYAYEQGAYPSNETGKRLQQQ